MGSITKKRNYMWLGLFCLGMAAGTLLVNYMVKTSVMDTSILTAYICQLEKKQFEDIYFFMYQQTGFFFSADNTCGSL